MNEIWLKEYFDLYKKPLFDNNIFDLLLELKANLELINSKGGKTIIMGNGGSAAIASHVAVDFSKNAKIRMVNYNEADLITCLSNDYGFENWVAKAVEFYGDEGDLLILISSSGNSMNMINAAKSAKKLKFSDVVTFSGFSKENPLKSSGNLNLWIDSKAYNFVENIHQIWLLSLVDLVIGNKEYSA